MAQDRRGKAPRQARDWRRQADRLEKELEGAAAPRAQLPPVADG